jgi:hypothetical protein
MRQQEQGVWHGGMLAVCLGLSIYNIVLIPRFGMVALGWYSTGRNGVSSTFANGLNDFHNFGCRMGKTIQIISLLVSDPHKPNLVVA